MTTNFFQTLYNFFPKGEWIFSIKAIETGEMIVSVHLNNPLAGVADHTAIPPLTFRNTPAVFDEKFFDALSKPITKKIELVINLEQHEKAVEQARANSKMEKDKKDKEKTEKDTRSKKFEEQMKRVDELAEQKKYGEAIGQLPSIADFPEQTAAINNKNEELRAKHGQLSMF